MKELWSALINNWWRCFFSKIASIYYKISKKPIFIELLWRLDIPIKNIAILNKLSNAFAMAMLATTELSGEKNQQIQQAKTELTANNCRTIGDINLSLIFYCV